jgi:hypothetical protein
MGMLYTERNNLRTIQDKTTVIDKDRYALLLSVCNKYIPHMAGAFPDYCQDNSTIVCGVNMQLFSNTLKFRIPDLEYDYAGCVVVPMFDEYNQYALLDYVEYIGNCIIDFEEYDFHSFFQHNHIKILETSNVKQIFRNEINGVFELTRLLYRLNDNFEVERVTSVDEQIESEIRNLESVKEQGLKELLLESVRLYKNPRPELHKLATEKIWGALERIKTVFIVEGLDKKQSIARLIETMANGDDVYKDLFNSEFNELTRIGNNYRIRHHETNKTEITDERYYDYFYGRCFALIALAIKFI